MSGKTLHIMLFMKSVVYKQLVYPCWDEQVDKNGLRLKRLYSIAP